MKQITYSDIKAISPCYDPIKYIPEDWTGTVLDILNVEDCPANDRIWVVTQFIDDKTNRLFAVWCAREALKLVEKADARSVEACNVAERYANDEATDEELAAAGYAAGYAARSAARSAAYYAAYYAASSAASYSAAREAAWEAAWAASRTAAWAAQVNHLKTMIQ